MEKLIGIFVSSFLIGFSGAMMPGPMFVVVVSQSPRRGWRTGPLVVLGHAALETTLVGALVFGMAEIFRNPTVMKVVAFVGGIVLLYMAIDMLRSAGKLSLREEGESAGASKMMGSGNPFWAGILTSLSNPYWIIWWATVGLGLLVLAQETGPAGIAAFLIGHLFSDLAWYTVVSSAASAGKWMPDSVYRGVIRVCGVALLFFAVYFGYSAVTGVHI